MKDKMAKLIEITGKALSGEWGNDDNTGNGIPVLRTTNFTNEGIVNYNDVVTRIIEKKKIEEKYLRKGDIIIEKSGGSDKQPVGRVVYFDGPENTYLFNNFTGLLRVKDQAKWYPRYVFYSLFSNYHRGGTRAFQNKTTGLHNLKIDDFVSRCEVTEAGINEQIAACKQMDRVNDIIRMHQQQLQKLDELVKARFIELFGTETEFDKWPCCTIGDVADVCVGVVIKPTQYYTDKGIPAFRSLNIGEMHVKDSDWVYFTEDGHQKNQKSVVHKNDVLVVRSGAPGTACVATEKYDGYNAVDIIIAHPDNSKVNSIFLAAFTNMPHGMNQIRERTGGAAQQHFNVGGYKTMRLIMPSIELQNQYAAFVEQTDKSKVAVQKALDEAQLLVDSLMQKYFQ